MNPGEDGCGGEGVAGVSKGREMILWFLRGSHTMSEVAVTREI